MQLLQSMHRVSSMISELTAAPFFLPVAERFIDMGFIFKEFFFDEYKKKTVQLYSGQKIQTASRPYRIC
jgi:hypothetical protein